MGLEAAVRKYPNGAIVIKQGDPGESVYLIRNGKVRIFMEVDGAETTLTTLGQGEFFGEMALFDDHPRSASAQAVGDVELAEVSREAFNALPCDDVVKAVMTGLAKKIRAMSGTYAEMSRESEARREFVSNLTVRRNWVV